MNELLLLLLFFIIIIIINTYNWIFIIFVLLILEKIQNL
jgi:hypothetical protein